MQISDSSSRILAGLLEARTGQQLTMSRRWRIETALSSLLRERGIATLDELITILVMGKEPNLSQQVVEALLNNETYFFRDRAPFDLLAGAALPRLAAARGERRRLRIWCAGCSTGQEAFSVAMLLADGPDLWEGWSFDILGTDVSQATIARANDSLFSKFEVQRGLPVQQMVRHFTPDGADWRVTAELRRQVRFLRHNLLDPPPGRFDLILCRNVLLYLAPELRRRAFEHLASAIMPDGVLMLGAGETVIGQTDRFVSDPDYRGLYRSAEAGAEIAFPRARSA